MPVLRDRPLLASMNTPHVALPSRARMMNRLPVRSAGEIRRAGKSEATSVVDSGESPASRATSATYGVSELGRKSS